MTRDEAKELLPIIQAWVEGKTLEYYNDDIGEWQVVTKTVFINPNKYRIKPEPKYRPFKSQEECWQEMHQHPDFGWVIRTGVYLNVFDVYSDAIHTPEDQHGIDFDDAFNELTFTDGEPFGIKEE